MRDAHVGEDEEAAIVCQQRESLELERGCPSDPLISNSAFQRCTGPSQERQPAALVHRSVAQGLSDHSLEPEIVMLSHQPVPKWLLWGAHQTDFNAFHHVPGL
jgi:hypothetical protein